LADFLIAEAQRQQSRTKESVTATGGAR